MAAVISALAATIAGYLKSPAYPWLKSLPLLLMMAALALAFSGPIPVLILAYFLFCWLGDVALLSKKGFLFGLSAFLLAHGALIWLLQAHLSISLGAWAGIALLALGLGGTIARWLRPGPPVMVYAVWFYAATLVLLLTLALWISLQHENLWRTTVIWVLLFVGSDLLLAYDRFRHAFRSAQLWILSTYFGSQLGWIWFWPTALQTQFSGYFN